MSAIYEGLPELDLRAQIARIDRDQAETHKLGEEARTLSAEAAKLQRERGLAPIVIAVSLAGSLASGIVVAVLTRLLH